ncbi:universal stress protein [Streptomyces sp. ME02-8801-2C]|uniref:universal stress protein n=1 Tax=Streptomyces sp. ME02-8801-2C TaxID=3028680 RepID=UPI0029B58D00|nr:universal stress protein [Streptomyces sp. ME02-8801-2C]MDX3458599.1 universal stress protein [Streptomyces sp. ME02-8801-2C]
MSGPVVVGVDGSLSSLAAVEVAAREADRRGADPMVLDAWSDRIVRPEAGPAERRFAKHDRDRLPNDAIPGLGGVLSKKYPDVVVHCRRTRGWTRQALVEASAGAQLVVVGAHGRGGLTGLLPGSVSEAVLRHAHCPVAVAGSGKE